ncbi:MAG: tyrosine-type recombinase/integrase [Bryobacteraceae bacterium]
MGTSPLFQHNGYWFYTYGYTVDGEQRKKKKCLGSVEKFKTEAAVWTEAKRVRDQFITDVKTGKVATSAVESVTCSELLTQYIAHLKAQRKPAAYVIEKCIEANIRPFFGSKRIAKLQSSDFERYREIRTQDVSDATVDHDFAYLKSALLFEYKKTPSRVARVPHIPKSGEDNVRHGFVEFEGYEKLLAELPLSLKSVLVVGYHIGNRKGALLDLKWPQVDFKNRVIRFIRMQNRKPVPVAAPIYGDMEEWLRWQKAYRDEHFPECEFVFFWYPVDCEIAPISKKGHGGRRTLPGSKIKSFYDSWRAAVKNAGFPELLFHDLRRSAVRNMVEKIGMSEKRAMEISGHKTRSCFERYHIVSLADIQESGQKMDKWIKAQRGKQERETKATPVSNRRKVRNSVVRKRAAK